MAKNILGHISRTMPEIIEILLKGGTYSCPMLPHYRYNSVQSHCRALKKLGLIKKSGFTNVGVNYKPSDLLIEWKQEHDVGLTTLMPIKWAKKKRNELKIQTEKEHHDCDNSRTETKGEQHA